MKEKLSKIVDYLLENTNYNKEQIIMIINPLETPTQASILMNWIKEHDKVEWYLMRKKALEIAH